MSYATVGVDIAKSVMQLHWVEPETGFKCSPPAIPQKIARRRALSPNRTFRATGITAYLKKAARSRMLRRWRTMRRRAPRSCMTGAATTVDAVLDEHLSEVSEANVFRL
jgi:hypothetical protein